MMRPRRAAENIASCRARDRYNQSYLMLDFPVDLYAKGLEEELTMLKIGHEVVRPGKLFGDKPVTIPVPEELETVPGIPTNDREVDWYAREHPEEMQDYSEQAAQDWQFNVMKNQHAEVWEMLLEHSRVDRHLVLAGRETADMEPTAEPTGEDVTQLIKDKARQVGYNEVGFTAYDPRYEFKHKRGFTHLPTAICLAYEQDFEPTQTIPSVDAEIVHAGAYRTQAAAGLELGKFIRSLGYRAYVIHSNDAPGPMIPMFVAAGLGQLGACGYLLSPNEGNRNRLIMITTDAKVTLRRASRLRHPRLLPGVPDLRQPLSRTGPDAGQDLVAGRGKEQGLHEALPAGDGPLPGMRGLHESMPHPEVRHEERHGALRRNGPGAGQGHPRPGRVRTR